MSASSSEGEITVGSWPGSINDDNAFIAIFCDALRTAGLKVVDVQDPRFVQDEIDVLQIHWAEAIYWRGRYSQGLRGLKTIATTLWSIARLRRRGVKIAWLVHNLRPHDAGAYRRVTWRAYAWALARMTDGFVTLSPATLPIVAKSLPFRPDATRVAVRHPRYPTPTPTASRSALRQRLDAPRGERLLVFAGLIRPYKGVDRLMSAVADAPPGAFGLIVAGALWDGEFKREVESLAALSPTISLRQGKLPDTDYNDLIWASDYVALPFAQTLHSGSIIHALSLGRPVLTPATPFALDLAALVGDRWVQTYDADLTPEVLTRLPESPNGSPDLSALQPEELGLQLKAFYAGLCRPGS